MAIKMCPNCNKPNRRNAVRCSACGANLTKDAQRNGLVGALKFFAWLDLISSICGAIWIWSQFSKLTTSDVFGFPGTTINPVGIGIGIGILFQGILGFVLFLTVASIAENVIEIRKKL